MKLGVALSGCDVGGICAHRVLEEVQRQGYEIAMVAASSVPAASALVWSTGLKLKKIDRLGKRFLKDVSASDLDTALAALAGTLSGTNKGPRQDAPVCVAACNLPDGRMVLFTDRLSLNSDTLSALPLQEPYDMLSATVSGTAGLRSYVLGEYRLCDYSARYGCPVAPLRLCGLSKVLSISFLPAVPSCAYEAALCQSLGYSCPAADLHLPVLLPPKADFDGCVATAVKAIQNALPRLEKAEAS